MSSIAERFKNMTRFGDEKQNPEEEDLLKNDESDLLSETSEQEIKQVTYEAVDKNSEEVEHPESTSFKSFEQAVEEAQPKAVAVVDEEKTTNYLQALGKSSKSLDLAPKMEADLFAEAIGKAGDVASISVHKIVTSSEGALEPIAVEDEDGRISEIIDSFSKKTGSRIIPAKMTRIPSWVTPKNHTDFVHGESDRYFVPLKDSEQVVKAVVEEALEVLKKGRVYTKHISQSVKYEGQEFVTYSLSPDEVRKIATLLHAYGPKAVDTSDGYSRLSLVVGDYVYGG